MAEITTQERVKALFSYLKELHGLSQEPVKNIKEYPGRALFYISDFLEDIQNI